MANFTKICHCLKENAVLLMTVICIFVGVAVGIVLNMFHAAEIVKLYIALPGELFMRALYFSVLPLLSCNIIAMSARLKPSAHGRIAVMSLIYCMLFNNIGGFIGVGVTSLINPGKRFNASTEKSIGTNVNEKRMDISDVLPDFLRNMVPDNIIKTLLSSVVTTHVREPTFGAVDVNDTDVIYHRQVGSSNGPNILGVLTSSLVLGLVAGSRLEKTQPLIALAEAVTEVMTVLVGIIIQLLPLAMISLIASALATVDNLENGVIALSLLVACSLCFNLILSIIVFPLIHAMFVRRNLFAVYKAMYRPLITAFCTTSSLITLPDLFKVCDQLGVEPYIVRTLAPFLTSFNANGSSAFIASAVCFTAQVTGFPLNVAQMIGIGFTHSSCRFNCLLSLISLHSPSPPKFPCRIQCDGFARSAQREYHYSVSHHSCVSNPRTSCFVVIHCGIYQ
ncbi:Amino acid transporter [Fasciola gigantica]|uniref:Amino acid transporter n=1 Tax=Fasciola gigantica TaxID=46835 RepID=A0A504YA95_FASGI|nr:Amino acid transporter [Fasciola gigantica]